MVKKLWMVGVVAVGAAFLSAPAHADTNAGNTSTNRSATQSGNNFGNVSNVNTSGREAAGVNNVNGVATTTTTDGAGQ
ncbi:hypothetical protein [Nonomuraea sp. NPDC050783]|uniref:hypothetical protein n=1 Tax=Nonomuraea sp. NPDC050783 TaxID=3154634 RepID=UPI003466D86C